MGCLVSIPAKAGGNRKIPGNVGDVLVFLPGLRIPKSVDFSVSLGHRLSKSLVECLTNLRARMIAIASQEARVAVKQGRRKGGSTLTFNLQALENYLSILLGLVKDGNKLEDKVQFVWTNQEDDAEETSITNGWYEVLSVLHLMATLCLSEANFLLLPKSATDGRQPKVSEESRRTSIDILLKGAGYLDYAIKNVLPRIPSQLRTKLPVDLMEGVLEALCMQALGQVVDIQLGVAIDSPKATLAVKRRLACEMVKYWQQANENLSQVPFATSWGQKHCLFVKWKDFEAKAYAYYYHGLILDEGNTGKSHQLAVAALQASENFLKESKQAREAFHASPPTSRNPPPWGSRKYLSEKIPKDSSNKMHINQDLYSDEKILEGAPALPDFALALKPDEYQLPLLEPTWTEVIDHKI